jgi:hypothetical protein
MMLPTNADDASDGDVLLLQEAMEDVMGDGGAPPLMELMDAPLVFLCLSRSLCLFWLSSLLHTDSSAHGRNMLCVQVVALLHSTSLM